MEANAASDKQQTNSDRCRMEASSLKEESESLRQEIERLNEELLLTSKEKHQSAELGLQLLDEKEELQKKYEDLELAFEATKHDLEVMRSAYSKSQTSQKVSANTGIEQEESLLLESASKEASFASTIQEIERELKQVRLELERTAAERERLLNEHSEIMKQMEVMEWERKAMRNELKDLKLRESRLLSDMNECEEENISLQKQVSNLKSNQIDFESAKHEVRRLQEELELRRLQVDEYETLKNIAEKQMKEALEALESEREQKYELKKKLDERINNDSFINISNLGLRFPGLSGFGSKPFNCDISSPTKPMIRLQMQKTNTGSESNVRSGLLSEKIRLQKSVPVNQNISGDTSAVVDEIEEDDGNSPLLHQLESDFLKSRDGTEPNSFTGTSSQPSSLFGEVHLSEIKKLEQSLEMVEAEKNQISLKLSESHNLLEKSKSELNLLQLKLGKMITHIRDLLTDSDLNTLEAMEEEMRDFPQLLELYKVLQLYLNDAEVAKIQQSMFECRNKLQECEKRKLELEKDLLILNAIAEETQGSLCWTQDDLTGISEELADLYHHVCHVNGVTPNRIILDHATNLEVNNGQSLSKITQLREKLSTSGSAVLLQNWKSGAPSSLECNRMLETVRDQIRHLKIAIESTIELKAQRNKLGQDQFVPCSPSNQSLAIISSSGEVEELQEQTTKLNALLSTKREQIATLRTVLKANKQTAEVALANLKSKYETEKAVVTETMAKLRNELKALKEDAATFASLRSMFAARCEEYVAQNDELQRQLQACEEEKKTLNSLLRIAIQQKLSLTQRLEDIEMDRERVSLSSSSSMLKGKDNKPGSGARGASRIRGGGFVKTLGSRMNPSANQSNHSSAPRSPLCQSPTVSSNSNSYGSNPGSPRKNF
ncbi:Protein bicaudal D-like protein [Leptotrombidium deliense]|uniref:Protein bicaudal D-like protein n=1 Tax=Leptotrombidium deliense TaxID=299467 RepID=A0A443SNC8_9ACAR|nr:Protein bicaudal D-like protein [Leptotrombidium deliense]